MKNLTLILLLTMPVMALCETYEPSLDLISGANQLTFEGQRSGESYFSADGTQLVFQSEREPGNPFYQIYLMDLEFGDTRLISPGYGKTTCAWIHPDGEQILFASTHLDPEARDKQTQELEFRASGQQRRYAWDYDEHFDLFVRQGDDFKRLTHERGYDAEGSFSPDGQWIAFASNRLAYSEPMSARDAELFKVDQSFMMDIYLMRADGSDVRRLTTSKGYDGGPFFSPDGKKIVWRRFSEDGATAEIYTMNIDGTEQRQITRLNAMSWAPYYHPSGRYIIFTNNLNGFANFELYLVDSEGKKEPIRVTNLAGFDGLPVFSPDGQSLYWTSQKNNDGKSQIHRGHWDHEQALKLLELNQ